MYGTQLKPACKFKIKIIANRYSNSNGKEQKKDPAEEWGIQP